MSVLSDGYLSAASMWMRASPSSAHRRPDALRHVWLVVPALGFFAVLLALTGGGAQGLPGPIPTAPPPPQSSRILDAHGRLIALLHGDENRIVVAHDQIPNVMRDAVVAIEDHTFFEHDGVSIPSMARALLNDLTHGHIAQGGSTITQQYVRNAYPQVGTDRTLSRKIREAVLAMKLEEAMPKAAILDAYLNTVYFGQGAYGVQAAARRLFGVPASKLTLGEAAFLAGAIQAPETYTTDLTAGRARRDEVLDAMVKYGYVAAPAAAAAKRARLALRPSSDETEQAPYFVEYVRRLLLQPPSEGGFGLTDADILRGGLTIYTTLDLDMQHAAERAVSTVLDRPNDPETGMVAMTTDGQIRAMVGAREVDSVARAQGFNYATQIAPGGGRQAGSAFKPFTLAAYLDEGFSPYRSFSAPERITIPQCPDTTGYWSPANYDGESYGALNVIDATVKSVNTVFAQLVALVGPAHAMSFARAAGITSPLSPVCSITLGVFGVTPLEMARAYATFDGHGARPDPIAVTKIVAPNGAVVAHREPRTTQTIDPKIADGVTAILQQVVQRGTGTPAAIDRPSAGKTGTTDSHRDVWYVGYTPPPGLVAAVWIGYPPNKDGYVPAMPSLHGQPATGGGFAGAIWKLFMQRATAGMPVLNFKAVDLSQYGNAFQIAGSASTYAFPQHHHSSNTPSPQPSTEPRRHPKR